MQEILRTPNCTYDKIYKKVSIFVKTMLYSQRINKIQILNESCNAIRESLKITFESLDFNRH